MTTRRRTLHETVARPVLFRLNPEAAHHVVMAATAALSRTVGAATCLRTAIRVATGRGVRCPTTCPYTSRWCPQPGRCQARKDIP